MVALLAGLNQWISLFGAVYAGGEKLWSDIKGVLANHGIQADTDALDAVIADAARREGIAREQALGGSE